MSLEYHPDRRSGDPDAERIFKLIQQSYEILSDPFERKKHDDWIAQKEGKTTQQRRSQNGEKDRSNRERDTKKENKSNYTTVRKTRYFSPAFVVFLIFAIGSTYQMWEWSRTGAIEDFLDQYLDRKIETVSTSSDSIVADSNEVVTTAPVIESRRLPFRITEFITSLMSSDEQEPEVTPEKIISPEVIETEQIINDVTVAETSENLFADALLDFYEKANGDDWIDNTNWGTEDYCSWYGITCRDGKVVELVLEDNKVSGEISSKIVILTSLERLILDNFPFRDTPSRYEGLKGEIPSNMGQLIELRELRLSNNSLSGDIPSIKNLVKLKRLELINNHELTGPIPEGIENFSELEVLALNNKLSGSIPSSLGGLKNLTHLSLGRGLVGEIPPELGDLSNLTLLGLGGNNLTGTIPVSFAKLTNLERLFLQDNALTGKVPQFILQKDFDYIDIEGNNFDAEISEESLFKDVLLDFYEKANGDNWTNNDGWGVGDYCTWYGITCDGVEVTEIRLQSNNLVGTISEELSHLTSLKILHINKNELSGFIPAELGDLANIVNLRLGENRFSGSIPAELGNLPNLTYLSLADNELSGSIPLHLGNLTSLRNLFLMNNQLTGSIPPELGNLTRLSLFGLSNNRLSGSIPTELGNLTNLYRLWLDNNLLSGSVPKFLNEMDLETLDLDGNNFDAEISTSQELINSLNTLNEMYEKGLLTDEEFQEAKSQLLL